MGFLFAFVTLSLGGFVLVWAVEVIPSFPVARFLKLCLIPIFVLGSLNRCFETWEIVTSDFYMSTTDAATFASRTLQLALFTYGTLRYFREGPSGRATRQPQSIARRCHDDIYGPKTGKEDEGLRYDS